MKKLMLLMLLICVVLVMHAQPGKGDGRKPPSIEERTERAKKELDLSDEQVGKWKEIHEKYEKDLKSALDNKDREKAKATMDKMDAELKAILTEDQQKKFAAMKKKRPRRRRSRGE